MRSTVGTARARVRSVGTIALGGTIASALQLLVGVVSARALGPEGRGALALLVALAGLTSHLKVFGLDVIFARAAATASSGRGPIVAGALVWSLVAGGLSLIVYGLSAWVDYVDGSVVEAGAFAVFVSGSTLSVLLQAVLLGMGRFEMFAFFRGLFPAIMLVGYTGLWLAGEMRAAVFFAVGAASALGFAIILALPLVKWRMFVAGIRAVDSVVVLVRSRRKELIDAGQGALLRLAEVNLPLLLLGAMADRAAVGLFAVATVACSVQAIVGDACSRYAFGAAASQNHAAFRHATVWLTQALAVAATTPLAWLLLPWVYGEAFAESRLLVPILAVATAFASIATVTAEQLRGAGRSDLVIAPRLGSLLVFAIVPFLVTATVASPLLVVAFAQLAASCLQALLLAHRAGEQGKGLAL